MTVAKRLGLLVAAALIAIVSFWAGRTAIDRPADPIGNPVQSLTYTVQEGTVARSLPFRATAEWELAPIAVSAGTGVVTTVDVVDGMEVFSGDVLFTRNLRPVTVAEGSVPMFRDLQLRTSGSDVAQLQAMLAALGFYEGEGDGSFGVATRNAVRAWQDSLGLDADGAVQVGDLVFVPALPARVALGDGIHVGSHLTSSDVVLAAVPEAPNFRIRLSSDQATLVPLSSDVAVTYAGGVWPARIERATVSEFGDLTLVLAGADGGAVCQSSCSSWVDLRNPIEFQAEVVVIPETTGPAVPVGAVTVDAGNSSFVTLADGSKTPVRIRASANGIAIVEGVEIGTDISIPINQP